MNNEEIIKLIVRKDLPLPEEIMGEVINFCYLNQNFKALGVIVPTVLNKDWLNSELDPFVAACKHTNVMPIVWRAEMEEQCECTVKAYLSKKSDAWKIKSKPVAALLMWRGALAYLSSLEVRAIPVFHMQVKRDEETLEISILMPLTEPDKQSLLGYDEIIIPDPMLASGMSNTNTICMLNDLGVPNEKITLLCVVAAPEGVFHILNRFPGVKIIAAAINANLNENAYIVGPGLGDAGDKYFWGNKIDNFNEKLFEPNQLERLKDLLIKANK